MKAPLKFRPNLQACELEDRLVPVVSNLGVMVLTPTGYVLMIPFPGAATPGGSPGGAAIPTSFVMTDSGGISSVQPGTIAGLPSLTATTTGSNGNAPGAIAVSPGANDPNAAIIPVVSRNTIANDALNPRLSSAACWGTTLPSCRQARSIGEASR